VDGFHANAKLRVQVVDVFSMMLTSSALATNQVWPFVTIKDFDAHATAALSVLGAHYIGVYPYVVKELRRPWEEYTQSSSNLQWVNESIAFQEFFMDTHNRSSAVTRQSRALLTEFTIDFDDNRPNITVKDASNNSTFDGTYGTNPRLFRVNPDSQHENGRWVNEDSDAPGPFFPMWQISPATESVVLAAINNNVLDPLSPDAFTNAISAVQETGKAVFGGVWNVDDKGHIGEDDDFDDRTVPAASLIYPIFDTLVPDKQGGRSVVAVIDLDYEFGPFFSSVLPPNADAVIAVVSNCDQVFTYEVTGEMAVYLGAEDLHDPNYDDYMVSTLMTDFDDANGWTVYNGAPINKYFCPWELKVYATQQMEDNFVTTAPFFFMVALWGVFLFTCVTFIVYDRLVEVRQKKVMTTAVTSDKIVSSLFPTTIREALYLRESSLVSLHPQESKGITILPRIAIGSSKPAQSYLASNASARNLDKDLTSEQLAQLHVNCTVFFGAITGFTAWSSARSPTQVFTLLEAVYAEFDKLADKHHVFKIETIGDCYVCVTGLPEPQTKHALQMARFALDCARKMTSLTKSLEGLLGPGTCDLALQVGLHSGPVTAGVLKCKKAQFQLFGDTVNTGKRCLPTLSSSSETDGVLKAVYFLLAAARMQSLGHRNLVHASQDTADILIGLGKSHWLVAREDHIVSIKKA
jgi:class 3 adenylate cyclase